MPATITRREPPAAGRPRSDRVRNIPAIDRRPEPAGRTVRVADLMTLPHVAEPDAPLLEIVYRMLTLGQREIVVVNGQRRPLGLLTLAGLAVLSDPGSKGTRPADAGHLLPSRTPRLLPDQDVATAASIMSAHDAEALPVVDHAGRLIGVLTSRHVVAQVGRGAHGRRVSSVASGALDDR